ncbi:MAG: DUF3106 domain-containing protein [Luteimonas sp.]
MPVRPVTDATAASAALSAFLRGIERRGAVFAHLQAGDDDAGTVALATAMASFRAAAARTAFGDWPRRFWALLLATPELREPGPGGRWPAGFEALARVGRGPRAALLLRLVAQVSEADAAAVLGVSRPTYRMALRRALPRDAEGGADETAWRLLGDSAQQAVRDLPPERLSELARVREAALQGQQWKPAPPVDAEPPAQRPRWLWPALAAVVIATVAALAATALLEPAPRGPDAGPERILSEALSPPTEPASTWDDDLALLTHPDFELLAAHAEGAVMEDPAFHAWLVHQVDAPAEQDLARAGNAQPSADAEADRVLPPALQELAASLPAAERTRLARRHASLQALAPDGLAALRARAARWETLELAELRAHRDAWQAWNRLPMAARTRMQAAAAAYAELPEERRLELAGEFAGLDALERNGWRLGPDLGADWPTLHPLFALVPAQQQEELLAVLLSMEAAELADLRILAQRTPPGERDALLTTPAENRAAWLRQLADR